MSYTLIAAIGKNNELGRDNELIWHLPNDLKFFKEKTTGNNILMGRKTFESLGRILPNRHHIVLSSSNDFDVQVEVFNTLDNLLNKYNKIKEEVFIIGGASMYKTFINLSNKMYLTEIDSSCEDADTFFPQFNKDEWNREELSSNSDNGINYKHVLYKRKKEV